MPSATLRGLGVLGDVSISPTLQELRTTAQRGRLCVHGAACVLARGDAPGQEPPERRPLAHMAHSGRGAEQPLGRLTGRSLLGRPLQSPRTVQREPGLGLAAGLGGLAGVAAGPDSAIVSAGARP